MSGGDEDSGWISDEHDPETRVKQKPVPDSNENELREAYLEAKKQILSTISTKFNEKTKAVQIPHEESMKLFLVLYMEGKLRHEEHAGVTTWKKQIESNTQEQDVNYEQISEVHHTNWLTEWHKCATDTTFSIVDKCPNRQYAPITNMADAVVNIQLNSMNVDDKFHDKLYRAAKYAYYNAFKLAITHTAWERFKGNKYTEQRQTFMKQYLFEFTFNIQDLKDSVIKRENLHRVMFKLPKQMLEEKFPMEYERARAAFFRMANEYYKAMKTNDWRHFYDIEDEKVFTVGSQYLVDPNVPVPVLNSTLRGSRRWLISEEV